MNGVTDTQTQLQILVRQAQQHLENTNTVLYQTRTAPYLTLKHKANKQPLVYQRCTLPLLMFSEQARMYMGIPMTTSSQAWTAPALHSDMHVFRVSSACWRRSSCSSPSDRLCCVRLSESGLVRRSYGVAYRRGSGSEGYGNQKSDSSGDRLTSKSEGVCIKNTPPNQCVMIQSNSNIRISV